MPRSSRNRQETITSSSIDLEELHTLISPTQSDEDTLTASPRFTSSRTRNRINTTARLPRNSRRILLALLSVITISLGFFIFKPETVTSRAKALNILPKEPESWLEEYRKDLIKLPREDFEFYVIEPKAEHRYTVIWLHVSNYQFKSIVPFLILVSV